MTPSLRGFIHVLAQLFAQAAVFTFLPNNLWLNAAVAGLGAFLAFLDQSLSKAK